MYNIFFVNSALMKRNMVQRTELRLVPANSLLHL